MQITSIHDLIPMPEAVTRYFLTASPTTVTVKDGVPSATTVEVRAWAQSGSDMPRTYRGMMQMTVTQTTGTKQTFSSQTDMLLVSNSSFPFSMISSIDVSLADPETAESLGTNVTVPFIHYKDGDPGGSGADAVTYYMSVGPTAVRYNAYSVSATQVTVSVFKTVGDNAATLTTDCNVRTLTYDRAGEFKVKTYSNVNSVTIDVSEIYAETDRIEIILIKDNKARQRITVTFIQENSRIPIPEGVYDSQKAYICDMTKTPLVLQGSEYYFLVREGTYKDVDPATSAAEDGPWAKADRYQLAIVEMLFANFGKLASAIFSGDFMYSQHGRKDNADNNDYTLFDKTKSYDNMEWKPNLMMDFLNGEFIAARGAVRFLRNGGGNIGDGMIQWGPGMPLKVNGDIAVRTLTLTEGTMLLDDSDGNDEHYELDVANSPGSVYCISSGDTHTNRYVRMPEASANLGKEFTFYHQFFRSLVSPLPIMTHYNATQSEYIACPRYPLVRFRGISTNGMVKLMAVRISDSECVWLMTTYIGNLTLTDSNGNEYSIT